MNYDQETAADVEKVQAWFANRGILARLVPKQSPNPTPDLELLNDELLIGHCEVKSLGLDPWDWRNAVPTASGLLAFKGNYCGSIDKTKARIANAIVSASKQLKVDTELDSPLRIIAIVNRSPEADVLDFQAVARGESNDPRCPPYREVDNPNKMIGAARLATDALIWFQSPKACCATFMVNESVPSRADRCRRALTRLVATAP